MRKLHIIIFIDALGWESVKKYNVFEKELPFRNSVEMQFGYTCTAIPTILTGKKPEEHKHFSFFYYNPEKSPFKFMKWLNFLLPSFIFKYNRVRGKLSQLVKKLKGYTGYFQLYLFPFKRLHLFDYCEKKDLFEPKSFYPIKNITDHLMDRNIKYFISDWHKSDHETLTEFKDTIKQQEINFAYLTLAELDAVAHDDTKSGDKSLEKIRWYEESVREVLKIAKENYSDVTLSVISDHGMTTLKDTLDIKGKIEKLNLEFGLDYTATYDSTMARIWILNENSRAPIIKVLDSFSNGHILSENEKKEFGINFKDHMYGEIIYLLDPGYQIVPSDMGKDSLAGMHGYDSKDKDSLASFLTTDEVEKRPQWVGDYFNIMISKMDDLV
ncbi:MAG: hypothetical protein HOJ35_06905 [Bdellovibrionales bacterium]|nr:hypothetical protein [Bdellovibrionales bacterium]